MKLTEKVIFAIIILSFFLGIYFYPRMPDRIASHWNVGGQVDGYITKFLGLFLMPFISVLLFVLFILIPKIDPLKANIEKFRKYFDNFILLTILFLFYIYLLTVFWNIGINFNMNRFLVPAFGILFYYAGVLTENAKRNWFLGIRTPWTLSSDVVWDKTHKVGGRLFKVVGIIAAFGIIFPEYAFFFVFVSLILVSIYTIIYSYIEYLKEFSK